jgi:peptidoglycan/xylan/chitin deacetylase (PgdA/CDA1 family)
MARTISTACLASVLLPLLVGAEPSKPVPAPAVQSASVAPAPALSSASQPVPAAPIAPNAPKITYSACHVDGQYLAMTFDDGPHIQNTPRLLDMLKQRGIKATFFLVGECAAQYPQIVKRTIAEGHEVGNHSWSHPQLSKMTDASVHEELQKTQDAIVNACGIVPKIMRPPYGAFTQRQQRWCNGEFGYKVILWDVDPLDWKIRNSEHVESEILKHAVPGSIILSHDIHKTTVDAMPATLDALIAKGYKFVTVSELIAMDRPVTKAKPGGKAGAPGDAAAPAKTDAPAPKPSPEAAPAGSPTAAAH